MGADEAAEGAGAVALLRLALADQAADGLVGREKVDAGGGETVGKGRQELAGDGLQFTLVQGVEGHDLVQAAEKFRAEDLAQLPLEGGALDGFARLSAGEAQGDAGGEGFAAHIRSHDEHGAAEAGPAALGVGEDTVFHDL